MVFTDQAVTLNSIRFENAAGSYAIAGNPGITLEADSGGGLPSVAVTKGTHEFQLPVSLNDDTEVDVAFGAMLSFNHALNLGNNNLTKTGEGALDINNRLTTTGGTVTGLEGTIGGNGTVGGNLNAVGGIISPGAISGGASVVPEPGTLVLLLVGLVGLAGSRPRNSVLA